MEAGFLTTVGWFFFGWTLVGSVTALGLAAMIKRADAGELDIDVFADTLPGRSAPHAVSTPSYQVSYRSNLSRR